MKLFVLDQHSIYRRGIVACLGGMPDVEAVHQANSVQEAWSDAALPATDVVLVDPDVAGGPDFVAAVRRATGAPVIVCSAERDGEGVAAALRGGAIGCLDKNTLTAGRLAAAVRAACGVAPGPVPEAPAAARLTGREQRVLELIANGHPTREVAEALSYSERTVKTVVHDVAVKLGARTRSQAVAHAVREGLI